MIRKQGERASSNITVLATITLYKADFRGSGVVAVRVYRIFLLDSSLTFTIMERPAISSYRVFNRPGDTADFFHLTVSRQAAKDWMLRHSNPRAVLEEVTADEITADVVEGRAVA